MRRWTHLSWLTTYVFPHCVRTSRPQRRQCCRPRRILFWTYVLPRVRVGARVPIYAMKQGGSARRCTMQVVVDLEGVVFRVVFSPALNFYYFFGYAPPICSNLWALGLMNTRLVVFTYSYMACTHDCIALGAEFRSRCNSSYRRMKMGVWQMGWAFATERAFSRTANHHALDELEKTHSFSLTVLTTTRMRSITQNR